MGKLRGLAGGSPGPGLGVCVCVPACTEAEPPPCRRLLLRAVRILLECILVRSVEMNLTLFIFYDRVVSCVVIISPLQSKLLRFFAYGYLNQANMALIYFVLHK